MSNAHGMGFGPCAASNAWMFSMHRRTTAGVETELRIEVSPGVFERALAALLRDDELDELPEVHVSEVHREDNPNDVEGFEPITSESLRAYIGFSLEAFSRDPPQRVI